MATTRVRPSPFVSRSCCVANHVPNCVLREFRAQAVFRLTGISAADRIHRDHEVLFRVVGLSGADQRRIAGSNAACPMGNENGVALRLVEFPVGGVADLHACELLTALERELRDHMNGILSGHLGWMPGDYGRDCGEAYPVTHAILPIFQTRRRPALDSARCWFT